MRDSVPETVSENRTGQPVGAYLRTIRESRGLTLEDVAAATRIGKNYLLAIEEGAYEKLPSSAYIKGFLRVYAGYLGLSGDEIIARFEPVIPARTATVHEQSSSSGLSNEKRMGQKGGSRGRWFASLALLALVIVAAYLFQERPEPSNPAPHPAPLPPTSTPVAAVQPARSSSTTTTPPVAVMTSPAIPPGSGTSSSLGIILRLKVNQDSSLSITIDDSISQQYDLKAGDLIEWKGEKVFTLDIGNAGGIEGEFNGRPLKSFGDPGKSAHIVLSAQDR